MLTNDNTRRAIEAIKLEDRAIFHGDLSDYLIEVLESLEVAPTSSDAEMIKTELRFIMLVGNKTTRVEEMESCIDDWFGTSDYNVPDKEQPLYQPNNLVRRLKDWHLNVIFGAALSVVLFALWFYRG